MDHAQDLSQQLLRYQQKHANWVPIHSQHQAQRANLNNAAAVAAQSRLSHVTNLPKHTIEIPEDPVSNPLFHLASYNNDSNPLFDTQDHAYWTADLPRLPQQLYQQPPLFSNAHFSSSPSLPADHALMARTKQTARSKPTIKASTAHFDFPSRESAAAHSNWRSDIAGRSFGAPPPPPVPQYSSNNPFDTSFTGVSTAGGLHSPILLDGPILKSQREHASTTKKQPKPLFRGQIDNVTTSATHNAIGFVTQNDTTMLDTVVTHSQRPASASIPQFDHYRAQGTTSYPATTAPPLQHAATVPELAAARTFDLHIPQTRRRRPGRKIGAQLESGKGAESGIISQVDRVSDFADVGGDELANYVARTTYPSLRTRVPRRTATHPGTGYIEAIINPNIECGLAAEPTPPKASRDEDYKPAAVKQIKNAAAAAGNEVKSTTRSRGTRSSARLTMNESIVEYSSPPQIGSSLDLMPTNHFVDDEEASHQSPIRIPESEPIVSKAVSPPAAATKVPTIIRLKFNKPSTPHKVTKTRVSPSRVHKYSTRSRRHDSPQSDAALAAAIKESLKEKNKIKAKDQQVEKAVHLPIKDHTTTVAHPPIQESTTTAVHLPIARSTATVVHLPITRSTTTAVHLPIKGSSTTASTINVAPVPAMTVPGNEYGSNVRAWLNENVTPHVMEALKWVAVNEPEKPLDWIGKFLLARSGVVETHISDEDAEGEPDEEYLAGGGADQGYGTQYVETQYETGTGSYAMHGQMRQ